MHLNAEGVGGGATEDSRRATSLPSPLVSASLSLVVSHVPFSLLVRAYRCLTTDDVRFVMMWISFLINLFVVKGRRFVKGAQILAADFYQKMSSFVPRIEHQQRKMNNLRNDGEFWKKNGEQKESTCVTKKCTFFKVVVKKISTTTISGHSIWSRGGKRRRKKITVVVVRRGARTVLYIFITLSRRLRRRLG